MINKEIPFKREATNQKKKSFVKDFLLLNNPLWEMNLYVCKVLKLAPQPVIS